MKRDMELIRELLLFFWEKPEPEHVECPPIEEYDEMTIKYHLILLYEAGLLTCEAVKSSTSDRIVYVIPFYLTWQGHEFLDKIRSESTWLKVQEFIKAKGGSVAFSVVNQLATQYALQQIPK